MPDVFRSVGKLWVGGLVSSVVFLATLVGFPVLLGAAAGLPVVPPGIVEYAELALYVALIAGSLAWGKVVMS